MSALVRHTPGPWATDNCMSDDECDVILGYEIAGAGFPTPVASAWGADGSENDVDDPISREQKIANARLMAASPCLFAALVGDSSRIEDGCHRLEMLSALLGECDSPEKFAEAFAEDAAAMRECLSDARALVTDARAAIAKVVGSAA